MNTLAELQEYKCPNCGGGVNFDSSTQNMKCPYCDSEFEMDGLKHYDEELKNDKGSNMTWDVEPGGEWQSGETDGMRVYTCKSCGGEIVGDENTGATSCPYCDNPVVMTGQFSGALRPDYVIPFKLDKKAAMEALKRHVEGKKLLPKIFKNENRIHEIKGVYVPFWLFDSEADVHIRYKASKTRFWSDSEYDYTETTFYSVIRDGNIAFNHVPVDGSSQMADDLMQSIEPYDFKDAVDFQTAYLAGYLADKYDVDAAQSISAANERIKKSTEQFFASTVNGYSSVVPESSNINLKNGTAKYVLYPVWMLTTSWNGQNYTFAMNGQTGKFVGDLPVDKKAARKWTIGLTAVCSAVTYAGAWLLWLLGIL